MSERTLYTSSHSNAEGNCVQIAPPTEMRISSYSGGNGGNCIQVSKAFDSCVMVGDSKTAEDPGNQYLHVSPDAFVSFTGGLATAEFTGVEL